MNACFIYLTKPSPSTPSMLAGMHHMATILAKCGYDRSKCKTVYMTDCEGRKKPGAADINASRERFLKDIGDEPVLLVAMGAPVMNPLTKGCYPISIVRGEAVEMASDLPYPKGSLIYGMFDPAAVWADPGLDDLFERDIRHLVAIMNDAPEEDPKVDNVIIHSAEEVDVLASSLPGLWNDLPEEERFLVVDCEWHGRNWMDPKRYIRTVQIGYAPGASVTIELYRENAMFDDEGRKWPKGVADRKKEIENGLDNPVCMCPDLDKMWKSLKAFLQDAGHPIVGHNIIADWQWLLSFGVDIRKNVIYDTMLAEHLINSDGPFRLDEVAMRRTPFGRYSKDVDLWVHHHKEMCENGYGAVPARLLTPYGGADVDCPRMIMKAQLPILDEYGMMNPRGPNSEYPSLLDSTMLNELATDELERNGLPVDMKRLNDLIDAYQSMRAQLLSEITLMAMGLGMPDFNPNSQPQMRMLLFGKLGLTPVKTTGGQSWGDAVGRYDMDSDDMPSSSTDKSVLEMLQNAHPMVKKLLQFRRIDQTCKTWLRHPDKNGEGGLEPLIWADGKLHPSFLPLTSTGRYKTSSPNCFPAEVEVLTSKGWLRWDEAYAKRDTGIKLAQWDVESRFRKITFERPEAWHTGRNRLVRVRTQQQIDIIATPEHKFEVFSRKDPSKHKTVTAEDLAKCAEYLIPQAGDLAECHGSVHLSNSDVTLICAMQADGYIVPNGGVEFAFSKARKIERLRAALDAGGWSYRMSTDRSSSGKKRIRFYVYKKQSNKRSLSQYKRFGDWLLECDRDSLWRLSQEVFEWDGCRTGETSRNYASSTKENTDWVQILQLLFNRRAHFREYAALSGNTSYQVDVTERPLSHLANATCEHLPEAVVYCVTMPQHSVIVRYNGRVLFTRQSQNFPKRAEGYLAEIFGEGKVPPTLRTIVAPPNGFMMMEGDFCQAELFTMANISGDQNMIRLLTTPGLDLHDSTTLSSFNMKMIDEGGNEVTEDDLVRLAARIGAGSDEFQHYMKTMRYLQVDGKMITRAQFKSGPRISAKSLCA